jgi:hypothetical protein
MVFVIFTIERALVNSTVWCRCACSIWLNGYLQLIYCAAMRLVWKSRFSFLEYVIQVHTFSSIFYHENFVCYCMFQKYLFQVIKIIYTPILHSWCMGIRHNFLSFIVDNILHHSINYSCYFKVCWIVQNIYALFNVLGYCHYENLMCILSNIEHFWTIKLSLIPAAKSRGII